MSSLWFGLSGARASVESWAMWADRLTADRRSLAAELDLVAMTERMGPLDHGLGAAAGGLRGLGSLVAAVAVVVESADDLASAIDVVADWPTDTAHLAPYGLGGVVVFDQQVTAHGEIVDTGTSRFRHWLVKDGVDPQRVAGFLEQLQTGDDTEVDDVLAALGGLAEREALTALELFDRYVRWGLLVPDPSAPGAARMWWSCDGWCSATGDPVSTHLVGMDSGMWDVALADAALGFGRQLLGARLVDRFGSCRDNSFAPGTTVLLADGSSRAIEHITLGDEVWALDPRTGELRIRPVIDTITGTGEKRMVSIDFGESSIIATAGHPVWVESRREWVNAADLEPGDVMRSRSGESEVVDGVDTWTEPATVHNLTVADIHTFFVLAGDDPVLVHNCTSPRLTRPLERGDTAAPATNGQQRALATYLGFHGTGSDSRGQPIFSDGKRYIVHDTTAHNGGFWKVGPTIKSLGRKSTRTSTTDMLLNPIGE